MAPSSRQGCGSATQNWRLTTTQLPSHSTAGPWALWPRFCLQGKTITGLGKLSCYFGEMGVIHHRESLTSSSSKIHHQQEIQALRDTSDILFQEDARTKWIIYLYHRCMGFPQGMALLKNKIWLDNYSLCCPSGTEMHLYFFTKSMGEEQASLAFWNSGTAISLCVHVSVHTQNFSYGMDGKFQLEPLWLTKPHLLLWKTKHPGRAITLI